jgi:hypothetical protein
MTQPNNTNKPNMTNIPKTEIVKLAFDLEGKPVTLPTGYRPPEVYAKNFQEFWQIERANDQAGFHFFKPQTMRFFRSHIGRYFGAGVFVTSEIDFAKLRAYSIRVADIEGQIYTFGEFQTFRDGRTAGAAAKCLMRLLRDGKTVADSKGQTFTLAI